MQIRLDKYLADMGQGTRSQVKILIKKGFVTVNGKKAVRPEDKINTETDKVICDGEEIGYEALVYYMLHKPAGVVSATEDKHDKTVLDLIEGGRKKDLFPVGRLDKDTEGLLLLTNDGDLGHRLLAPRNHVAKVYYAKIDGIVTDKDQQDFKDGIEVDDTFRAMPGHLTILATDEKTKQSEIQLEIYEGKFHQVKRMFQAVGKEVIYLKRLSMGSLVLDESLLPGQYRPLTDIELKELNNHA